MLDRKCVIENCDHMARARSPVCYQCAANFRYWQKRPVSAVISRQHQLEKWQDRMQYLGSEDRRYSRAKRIIEKARS